MWKFHLVSVFMLIMLGGFSLARASGLRPEDGASTKEGKRPGVWPQLHGSPSFDARFDVVLAAFSFVRGLLHGVAVFQLAPSSMGLYHMFAVVPWTIFGVLFMRRAVVKGQAEPSEQGIEHGHQDRDNSASDI